VSKLTIDVVTYCTEASNQKSKYVYRKILFYDKSTGCNCLYQQVFISLPVSDYVVFSCSCSYNPWFFVIQTFTQIFSSPVSASLH